MSENVLGTLILERMRERGLSIRATAREIGVAHTTVNRVLQGENIDPPTTKKITAWLGIEPASAINAEGIGTDALAAQIAAVIEAEPELARVFSTAMARVLNGQMSPATLRELAAFAAYRLNMTGEDALNERLSGHLGSET